MRTHLLCDVALSRYVLDACTGNGVKCELDVRIFKSSQHDINPSAILQGSWVQAVICQYIFCYGHVRSQFLRCLNSEALTCASWQSATMYNA
jgi:hypothetical protein